jgi:hypothetical protein
LFDSNKNKISVLTMLIGVVGSVADGVFDLLSASDMKLLLDSLSYAHGAARKCDVANEKLRVKCELMSVNCILELLSKQTPSDQTRIASVMNGVLVELGQLSKDGLRRASLIPLAKKVLKDLNEWNKQQIATLGDPIFVVMAVLVQDNDPSVRAATAATMLHFWNSK